MMPKLPNAVITISRINDFTIAEGAAVWAPAIEFKGSPFLI